MGKKETKMQKKILYGQREKQKKMKKFDEEPLRLW